MIYMIFYLLQFIALERLLIAQLDHQPVLQSDFTLCAVQFTFS